MAPTGESVWANGHARALTMTAGGIGEPHLTASTATMIPVSTAAEAASSPAPLSVLAQPSMMMITNAAYAPAASATMAMSGRRSPGPPTHR
ncbi:MAG: hypothetical protein WEC14_07865 [Chloroflexota bacterium]